MPIPRLLLHLPDDHRIPIDPETVVALEAQDDKTLVHSSERGRPRIDTRSLGELEERFAPYDFVGIRRSWCVNPLWIRPRRRGVDWEVLVKGRRRALPVTRGRLGELWAVFGEE